MIRIDGRILYWSLLYLIISAKLELLYIFDRKLRIDTITGGHYLTFPNFLAFQLNISLLSPKSSPNLHCTVIELILRAL